MLRILLADDDREDVEIFTTLLNETGLEAELKVVHDGNALLEMLKKPCDQLPDYLFLDLAMPKRSGFECLNELRKDCDYDGMKIIILSDSINVGEMDDAYDLGANYFLTKPADLGSFRNLLLQILKNSWADRPSRSNFELRYQPTSIH